MFIVHPLVWGLDPFAITEIRRRWMAREGGKVMRGERAHFVVDGKRVCGVPECDRRHYGAGYCRPHYRRVVEGRKPRRTTCSVPGCGRKHRGHGYCVMHYSRWRRGGDVTHTKHRIQPHCDIADCGGRHHAGGLCAKHYYRRLRFGDPMIASRKEAVARGMAALKASLPKVLTRSAASDSIS